MQHLINPLHFKNSIQVLDLLKMSSVAKWGMQIVNKLWKLEIFWHVFMVFSGNIQPFPLCIHNLFAQVCLLLSTLCPTLQVCDTGLELTSVLKQVKICWWRQGIQYPFKKILPQICWKKLVSSRRMLALW